MGFTYPDKFTYLNTFVIQVAQRCSDNGGPIVHQGMYLTKLDFLHFTLPQHNQ